MLRTLARARPKRRRCSIAATRFEDGVDDAVAAILADRPRARRRGGRATTRGKFDDREPPRQLRGRARALGCARRPGRARRSAHALELAAHRIRAFHERQRRAGGRSSRSTACGSSCASRRSRASGLYVPGGTARYPSSVLMTAIPAKVAGVREVVMVTPGASPEALLAARLAGVDRVFEIGGAQAVGALAFGTADRAARRQDRRAGQRVRGLGEAPGLRRGRHRLDRGPVGGADRRRRRRAGRRGSRRICSRRPSTTRRRARCS